MGSLKIPKKGFENEHLAAFILSRFAFCASPVTVSDDVGSDFFCCIFQVVVERGRDVLLPVSSFAIQVKSSDENFDVTNKIQYFLKLEIPYLVGVVDRSNLSLRIYSGEWLPILFSHKGAPANLEVKLVDQAVSEQGYFEEISAGHFRILFPRITEISANASDDVVNNTAQQIQVLCRRVQMNLAARQSDEHLYLLPDPAKILIMAGPGSALVFRQNLYKRLAEALENIKRLRSDLGPGFDQTEAELYCNFVERLRAHLGSLPEYVERGYQDLKADLSKTGA